MPHEQCRPITIIEAISADSGTHFHHTRLTNSDGTPLRVRVSGRCKTWKTRPTEFRLPVKHGLYESTYITHEDCGDSPEWYVGYECEAALADAREGS